MDERQALANNSTPEPTIQRKPEKKYKKTICGCDTFTCSKWALLIYAVFFALIGAILLAVGVWAEILRSAYDEVNYFVSTPAVVLILVGAFILIVAFLGIMGCCLHHHILLKIFFGGIILVFVLQIVVGILAFVYREEGAALITSNLQSTIKGYNDKDEITKAMDALQGNLECCGFHSYLDWNENPYYECKVNSDEPSSCSVPRSCCKDPTKDCGRDALKQTSLTKEQGEKMFEEGCSEKFRLWVEDNLDVLGGCVLGFAIPQIIGIFLAYNFIIHVEDRRFLYHST